MARNRVQLTNKSRRKNLKQENQTLKIYVSKFICLLYKKPLRFQTIHPLEISKYFHQSASLCVHDNWFHVCDQLWWILHTLLYTVQLPNESVRSDRTDYRLTTGVDDRE